MILNYRSLSSNSRLNPSFLIVGTQKAGTTSLYNYLCEHSKIIPAFKKEVYYYCYDKNYNKGLNWYKAHFPLSNNYGTGSITGEATPMYIYDHKSASRIYKDFPNIKLILIFRDPVKRAYSHYNMEFQRGKEIAVSFEEAIQNEKNSFFWKKNNFNVNNEDEFRKIMYNSYLSRGHYYDQLKNYLLYFTREQMYINSYEEFIKNPGLTLSEIFDFLGLNNENIDYGKKFNVGKKYVSMNIRTEHSLREYYSDENEKLFELIGKRFLRI